MGDSKTPGILQMDSTSMKKKIGEEMKGTTPAETPIIVTGLESFTLHNTLGQGNFGKVMLATHPACQQKIALKIVKKRLLLQMPDFILTERLVLEATAKSPLFTHAYATFQGQDYVFFAMEYLSGGDLLEYMMKNAPLPIPVTRFFAAEITCGLQFLHSKGIIHRDIKPDNILMDSAGHLKIADFGLSVMNVFGDKKITEFVGTPAYMAPEVHLRKPFNASVDWFSAGIICYQMAIGKHPFGETLNSGTNVVKSLIMDNPEYPTELDLHARSVIQGLLNKSPERREVVVDILREHPFFEEINWTDIEEARACPPFQLEPPPEIKSVKMDDVLSSSEAEKTPIPKTGQRFFHGFTFASDTWRVIREGSLFQRTCCGIVRKTFQRIWRKIKCW